jgi:hypothetical protein
MKVLVATKETQGQRTSDFCWTNEGELVTFSFTCCGGKGDIDGGCGCQRDMTGLVTFKGTTTVKVVSKKMTEADLVNSLIRYRVKAWSASATDPAVIAEAEERAKELIRLANGFKVGDVLEIRGDKIQMRKIEKESAA